MRRRSDCRRAAKLGPGFPCGVHESFRLPELPRSKLYTSCTMYVRMPLRPASGPPPAQGFGFSCSLFNLCIAPTRACCHITIHGIHVLQVLRHNRQAAHTGRRHDGACARHPTHRLHFLQPFCFPVLAAKLRTRDRTQSASVCVARGIWLRVLHGLLQMMGNLGGRRTTLSPTPRLSI